MSRTVVVFEDHSLANFRPLAWSIPTYEMRVGVFNTRERVELAIPVEEGDSNRGVLLCRDILKPLHTCEDWQINPDVLPTAGENSHRVLWFNGRSRVGVSEISALAESRHPSEDILIVDQHGLVAADLSQEASKALWSTWRQWVTGIQGKQTVLPKWEGYKSLAHSTAESFEIPALGHIWDIVPATSQALKTDLEFLSLGRSFSRRPFGVFADSSLPTPFWVKPSHLFEASTNPDLGKVFQNGGKGIWLGENVTIAPGVVLDAANGPIILDRGVTVMPHSYLEGPLYVGPGSRIKAGATIYGESSFGIGNRLAGEIGESTFSDFANKQHDGFIGHAVLGSWTNLGAMTTCSDLKNNYGNVRVDLGGGTVDTGLRFVGLLMGDHVKTAIGTLFNTGTSVGFASNVFGGVMPPKCIGNYSWGGLPESPLYDVNKAISTAAIVMGRRGCTLCEGAKDLMHLLA